jgi:hypothetical protein
MRSRTTSRRLLVVIATCAIAFVIAFILTRASDERAGDDFWSVAVPGVLTGFGTLGLAVVTVWLSLTERRRDDRLRAEQFRDVEDRVRASAAAEAVREARKVMTEIVPVHQTGSSMAPWLDVVRIINAGSEPILDIEVICGGVRTGLVAFNDRPAEWQTGSGEAARPYLMAGGSHTLNGTWVRAIPPADIQPDSVPFEVVNGLSNAERSTLDISIAWTDSSGRFWRRDGRGLPEQLAVGWSWAQRG